MSEVIGGYNKSGRCNNSSCCWSNYIMGANTDKSLHCHRWNNSSYSGCDCIGDRIYKTTNGLNQVKRKQSHIIFFAEILLSLLS